MLDYFWFVSSQLQTRRFSKYNLNFLSFPHSYPLLDIFNILTSMTIAAWNFSLFSLLPHKPWGRGSRTHSVWSSDERGTEQLPSSLLWHRGHRARPSKCWRHLHSMRTATSRRKGEEGWEVKRWVRPPLFSMTHHENKSAGDLNYHIHLNRALSNVVLESSPNQQHRLRLTAVLTAASVTVLWINK